MHSSISGIFEQFPIQLATTARFARLRCSLRLQGDIVDFMCIMVPAPKKIWSWPTFEGLEAAGGSWGGQRPSGTTRDQCCGQKEPFEPKKNFGLGRPLMASRPLEGPGGAGHHQGPSGIDTGVKRNHLSQKKIRHRPAFDSLWRPPEAVILEGKAIFELVLT